MLYISLFILVYGFMSYPTLHHHSSIQKEKDNNFYKKIY